MADTWIIPGGAAIQENKDGATWLVPGVNVIKEADGDGVTLTVAELAGAGALDNIALTQKHSLAIQALDSAGLLDNITLELSTILVVAEALSSGALDNITLTQKHLLAIDALSSAGLLDNVVLIPKYVLAIQEALSSGTLDNIALTQKYNLVIQELLSAGLLDNVVLTQKHSLAIQELLSSGALDNTVLVDTSFPTGWGRKCELVIQHGQVNATLSNFPVLITKDTLPSEIFDADGSYPALNGGGDIRFSSDSAGNTQLPCEIEQFVTDNNPANGKAAIWVNVPSVASAANTSIWIWYNKSGESQPADGSTYGSQNVWDSNYTTVYHMDDLTTSTVKDSTSGNNGTKSSANNPVEADEKLAKGQDFSLDYITASSSGFSPNADFTISLWVNGDAFSLESSVNRHIISQQDGTGTGRSLLYIDQANNYVESYLGASVANSLSALSTGTYYFLNIIYDASASNVSIHINADGGNVTGSVSGEAATGDLVFGAHKALASGRWDGGLDEIRVSSIVRSADWVGTEYNNQNSPATFIIEGTPETPGAGITLTIAELTGAGALDNITLTQKHILAIQELLSLGVLDNITLTQKHILAIQALTGAGALDNITLSLSALLIVADLLTASSLDNITLTQKHLLAIQELLSSGVLDNIDLVQKHVLAVQALSGAGTIDNIDLIFAALLVVAEMLSAGALDNAELTQKHILTVDEVQSSGLLDNVVLTQANILAIFDLLGSGVIDEITFNIASGIICITLTQACEYNMPLTQSIEYDMQLTQAGGGICE